MTPDDTGMNPDDLPDQEELLEMGKVAREIAHDLNNIFVATRMRLDIILDDGRLPRGASVALQEVAEQLERASEMSQKLLVASRLAGGATLTVAPEPDAASETLTGAETILLVEDEQFVRRVTALSLRKLGYAVLEAANESEAVEMWQRDCEKIDLILTDMELAESNNGLALAERFRRGKTGLKVIVTSGFPLSPAKFPGIAQPGINQLTKPYKPAELARLVRRCLDEPTGAG